MGHPSSSSSRSEKEPFIPPPLSSTSSQRDAELHLHATSNQYEDNGGDEGVGIERSKDSNGKEYSFDMVFVRRFIALYKNITSRSTLSVTAVLLATIMFQTYVVSLTGEVVGGFYGAIIGKDMPQFRHIVVIASAVIIGSAILESTIKFMVEILAWKWRKGLCGVIQDQYFGHQLYYKLIAFDHRIDNPDQRITTDIDNFTITLAMVTQSCISYPIVIVLYSVKTYFSIAWFAPLAITLYFIIGYAVTKLIMSRIVDIVFNQEKLEGDFRFSHVRVRSSAEMIALLQGDKRELSEARNRLTRLLANKLRIVKWHWSINTSSNVFAYLGSVMNYVIVGVAVFFASNSDDDVISASYVAEASFNCIMLISGFSQLLNAATSLADLAGYTARIASLVEVSQEIKAKYSSSPANSSPATPTDKRNNSKNSNKKDHLDGTEITKANAGGNQAMQSLHTLADTNTTTCFGGKFLSGDTIIFNNVTCYTPTGKVLVRNLNFELVPSNNLLITGPSGKGKSSILRILTGLWPSFTGSITKPLSTCWELLHIPQKPYLTSGTLASQITYPLSQQTCPLADEDLLTLLRLVKLEYLFKDIYDNVNNFAKDNEEDSIINVTEENTTSNRDSSIEANDAPSGYHGFTIDSAMNWGDILSPGEQQRISIARVFYHRPKFVLLDEATSSLSEDMESEIYTTLRSMGITVISVGHRSSLLKFHRSVMTIGGPDNSWTLQSL